MPSASTRHDRNGRHQTKLLRLVTVLAILAAVFTFASDVFFLLFAGILLAIFISALAGLLGRALPLSYGWRVGASCVIIAGLLAATIIWAAPGITAQFNELTRTLPRSIENLQSHLKQYSIGPIDFRDLDPERILGSGRDVFNRATGLVSGVLGMLTNMVVILFIGLYGAAEPGVYKRGFVHLVPIDRRPRVEDVIDEITQTLEWWLTGKIISMSIIGVLTTLGLWLLDVPLALILGVIAALLTFIPNFGPLISAVPAVLLGLMAGPRQALYVALLYLAIQSVESYLITPLIQRKTISIPPGLTLAAQVLLGVLFGGLGVALATPLTAAGLVAVKRLYVEDTLHDHFAPMNGDDGVLSPS